MTFRAQMRPLRLACLIRNTTELITAVELYTHLWGGAVNRIFTLPDAGNVDEEGALFDALESFDPDYIFMPPDIKPQFRKENAAKKEVPEYLHKLYDQYGPRLEVMVDTNGVRSYGALRGWIGCSIAARGGGRSGYLLPNSHVLSERYHLGLKRDDSRMLLPPPANPYDFYFRMKMGAPCPEFAEYLRDGLGASTLRAPDCFLDMLTTQIVSCGRSTAVTSTTEYCRTTISNPRDSDQAVFFDDDVLGLFLCAGEEDIETACSFWNARGPSSSASLILPRAEVETHLVDTVAKLCLAFPALSGVYIVTSGQEGVLREWHDKIKSAFVDMGVEIPTCAISATNRFPKRAPRLVWSNPITLSRSVRADNAVIFSPPMPPAHDRKDGGHAFACDLEITLEGGRKLNLPPTVESAVLLSRDWDFIEYIEGELLGKDSDFLSRCASVRPHWEGITLIATAGEEATFFLPDDETVVLRRLARTGCTVRANRQTRYARGIVNLLGGFVEATRFFNSDGINVLQAICNDKARQCGLVLPAVENYAMRNKSLYQSSESAGKSPQQQKTPDEQRALIQLQLKKLLDVGLARRGFALTCPVCDLTDWHAVENLCAKILCPGCAQDFDLPLENPKYSYKANELAARFISENGGLAVLKTAARLRYVEDSGCLQFGVEISKAGHSDLEVDLVWVVSDVLVLVECKALWTLTDKQIEDIERSLDNLLKAANLLQAQIVLLAVYTPVQDTKRLRQVVEACRIKAEHQRIALHLLLNDDFYVNNQEPQGEHHRVDLHELLPPQERMSFEDSTPGIGEWPKPRRLGRQTGLSDEIVKQWIPQATALAETS